MYRRSLLSVTAAGVTGLAGCIGGGDPSTTTTATDDSGSGTQSGDDTTETPAPAIDVDGRIGERIENEGVTIKIHEFESVSQIETHGFTFDPLTNSQYFRSGLTIEVTGDTSTTVSPYLFRGISYRGSPTHRYAPKSRATKIIADGEELRRLDEALDGEQEKDLFPGDSISVEFIVVMPDAEYKPEEVVIRVSTNDVLVRGGTGDPSPRYSPPEDTTGDLQFGDSAMIDGVDFSVVDATFAERIETEGGIAYEGDSDTEFVVLLFELTNNTPVMRNIIPRPEVRAFGKEMDEVGVAIRQFTADGSDFTGLFATRRDRDNLDSDGSKFWPGVTVSGALAWEVPTQVEASDLEVVFNQGDLVYTS